LGGAGPDVPNFGASLMRAARRHGFTLTELAVVFVIVSLLLMTGMFTLSAQNEQRNFEETRRRLEAARELVLAFAVATGRLPCPGTASGDENPAGGGNCASPWGGFLPARTIGFQIVDGNGFGLDAYNNPIRYAVSSQTVALAGCIPASPPTPHAHFTNAANLRTNGITCQPGDLVICNRAPTPVTANVCDAGSSVTNQNTVVAIVFSTGKNGATGGTGQNEARNLDNNRLFISRTPDPAGAGGGEFDDQMLWIPVGELYGKLIAAGRLP
jgi:prepilin-type N-terminal cleavage/methylation domain-containing protein